MPIGHSDIAIGSVAEIFKRRQNTMAHQQDALLEAYAEVRRTWDELVGLQPDIIAASGPLVEADLVLLNTRVAAHLVAVTALEDQIEILLAERGA
jgi:hypothetical protein